MGIPEKYPFTGLTLHSVFQDPSKRDMRRMDSRRTHGFILKIRGATRYTIGDESFTLQGGEILFIRRGSSYSIREITPGYSYVVNFACDADFPRSMIRFPLPPDPDGAALAEKLYRHIAQVDGIRRVILGVRHDNQPGIRIITLGGSAGLRHH